MEGRVKGRSSHHENQWLCQQLPAMSCFFLLLMGNDGQMSQGSGVGPVHANPNVKRELCPALESMCSRGKERKEEGGVEMAVSLPEGVKINEDFPLQLPGSEMRAPAAAAPMLADTSGAVQLLPQH